MAGIKANHERRQEEWDFQAELAAKELTQVDRQIEAAKIRVALAKRDLENQELQIELAEEEDVFLLEKFTKQQLYSRLVTQVSTAYFQSYQMAYDLAKQAERAFHYELGVENTNFIEFGYWDNLIKGLHAGDRLLKDLRRMEVAYLEQNRREYELTKHVSLLMLNPIALLELKEKGSCEIELPEALFDLDYSGHYFRRIKSVSITIPAVIGPYTTLSCTLSLCRSSIRRQSTLINGNEYARDLENDDPRFSDSFGTIQSIATSSGQNDSGLFELNFRDERYLPFEGTGAISSWKLEMPNEFRQFNYNTITDVILHMNYTAREGGETLKTAALDHLENYVQNASELSKREGLFRMFSLKHEFPSEWHRFLHPEPGTENQMLVLGSLKDRLPFFANNQKVSSLTVQSVMLFTPIKELTASLLRFQKAEDLDNVDAEPIPITLEQGAAINQLQQYEASDVNQNLNGFWALQVNLPVSEVNQPVPLTADQLQDAWLVIKYQLTLP